MPRQLKVFRMPIGFEDAYVAAPSRAAALRAWGTEHDQFARGNAEEVNDPALMAEPLGRPGEVIRRSRGDLASQLKALPPRRSAKGAAPRSETEPKQKLKLAKQKPPPKRDKVDAAEAALKAARDRHERQIAGLEAEAEEVARRVETAREQQRRELAKLERARQTARDNYLRAIDKWSG